MPSATELLRVENSREAALVGAVAALAAGTVVTTLGSGTDGLAVGALTAVLFFVVLVTLNLFR